MLLATELACFRVTTALLTQTHMVIDMQWLPLSSQHVTRWRLNNTLIAFLGPRRKITRIMGTINFTVNKYRVIMPWDARNGIIGIRTNFQIACNTWDGDTMGAILQTFSDTFPWILIDVLLLSKFYWKLFPRVQITVKLLIEAAPMLAIELLITQI